MSWAPYTLKKGETLRSLADKTAISPEELAQANGLRSPRQVLLPGTVLLAPIVTEQSDAVVEAVLARFSGAKTVERVRLPAKVYRVRKNDTLAKIARRFGISVGTLKKLNRLAGEPKVGTRLTVRASRTQVVVTDSKGAVRLRAR